MRILSLALFLCVMLISLDSQAETRDEERKTFIIKMRYYDNVGKMKFKSTQYFTYEEAKDFCIGKYGDAKNGCIYDRGIRLAGFLRE